MAYRKPFFIFLALVASFLFSLHAMSTLVTPAVASVEMAPETTTAPSTSAPTPPARDAGDVISIYSGAYADTAGLNYNPNWGQSGLNELNAAYDPGDGNLALAYVNFNYQGTELTQVDASAMEYLHVDIWVPAGTDRQVKVSPINNTAGGGTGTGETLVEVALTPGSWNSVDLPRGDFTGMTWDAVHQLKFDGQFNGDGTQNTTSFDIYLDNIYFYKSGGGGTTAPTTSAPTPPARDAGDVISIYSGAYADTAGLNYNPNWGQSGLNELNAAYDPGDGNLALAYVNFNYQGTELTQVDASAMEYLHVDIWVPAGTDRQVKVSPINNTAGGGTGTGETLVEVALTPGSWNSVDLPRGDFTGMTWDAVHQLKFDGQFNGDGTQNTTSFDIYLDNIYFYKSGGGGATAPTTSAPTPPARDAGDVISIYSGAYADTAGLNYNPNWGQSGLNELNAAYDPGDGNLALAYVNFNYQGTELTQVDASAMEYLHVDIWVPAGTDRQVKVSPINNTAGGGTGTGETLVEVALTPGSWNSVDLPRGDFTGMTWDAVHQLKFDGQFNGDGTQNTTSFDIYLDNIYFYKSGGGGATLNVGFDSATYNVEEGGTATITTTLNMTSSNEVTVTYATSAGTATAGADYTATTGILVFPAGSTEQSFTVQTNDDDDDEGDETVLLTLSDPISATLGTISQATLTIEDNDASSTQGLLTDFEEGLPDGFFQYGGEVPTLATQEIADDSPIALPGQVMSNTVLSATFNVSSFGGFGVEYVDNPQDWSSYDGFSFWFYGSNSGLTYQAEIFDNGDNPATAERFDYNFVDDFNGWRHIIIPFSAFTRATDFQPGGEPNDGLTLTQMWGFAFPLPLGSSDFYLDEVALVNVDSLADFEEGLPDGFFEYGGDVTVFTQEITNGLPLILRSQMVTNTVLSATFNISSFGGFGVEYVDNPQDWSSYDGFSFWFYGSNSGLTYQAEIFDNGDNPANAERFDVNFVDDFNGWRLISLPFEVFTRATDFQPGGEPNDGLTLTQMWGFAFPLPVDSGDFYLDNLSLFGDVGSMEVAVAFDSLDYEVEEGGTATITATLNMTSSNQITVTYATSDSTALAGDDYTATMGTLVFPAGSTEQSFTVQTNDDAEEEGDETVILTLSDPISATLGPINPATLTIEDNDAPDNAALGKGVIIDDFESGLPFAEEANGLGIGYVSFQGSGSSVSITTTNAPPEAVPNADMPNHVLQMDSNVVDFAGMAHAFENEELTEWVSQDWSSYSGFSFWLYGNDTDVSLFIDIIENRNPGSTTDDAQRWTYEFEDDFEGWKLFAIPFEDFTEKGIGNGAPNDDFSREEVHGWAFGSLGSNGDQTHYLDDVALLVRSTIIDDFESGLPFAEDANGLGIGYVSFQGSGSTVSITTTNAPPEALPNADMPNHVLRMDSNVVDFAGMAHAFENEELTEWVSQDWSAYEGFCFWLYGNGTDVSLFIDIIENRNPDSTTDDAQRWTYEFEDDFEGWQLFAIPFEDFTEKGIGNGAPNDDFSREEVHGWAFGSLGSNGDQTHYLDQVAIYGNAGGQGSELKVEFASSKVEANEGETVTINVMLNMTSTNTVMVDYHTAESTATPDRDYEVTNGTLVFPAGTTEQSFDLVTIENNKYEQDDERVAIVLSDPVSATLGLPRRTVLTIIDNDPLDADLLDDFEGFHRFDIMGNVTLSTTELMTGTPDALPGQGTYEQVLTVDYDIARGGDPGFTRMFVESQDRSSDEGMSFWYNGTGSGDTMTVKVLDNQAATTADTDPSDWVLAWSDEFNDPAGTPPNPNVWTHELGDGALNEILGWGNSELQYYTDSTDNAAMDGDGNLVITTSAVNTNTTDLVCWYGPCEYTSARLISWHKTEFEYGRIESRIKVPFGDGLWPAFWTLGTSIYDVQWPQTGEIDIMEFVGREPFEVFGTIHGPGYNGGNAFGNIYTFDDPVSDEYHTFAIEWGPDEIDWYVDDIHYHNAVPADVDPNEWVFNHPFFMLLNIAVGGSFGGPVGDDTTFPQMMQVDYVRVYQAEDTAERFEATFSDDSAGWQQIKIPFSAFTRSTEQPDGAPDDGLGLTEMWGYAFELPAGSSGSFMLDQVRIEEEILNSVPSAQDDDAETDEDMAVEIDVLDNDTDADGDTLTITEVSDPANGSATTDGATVTYTPDENYNGDDSFTYTISDGNGGDATATVNLTINPVNDAPSATDDEAETDEDTAVEIDVLDNDTDIEGDTLTITEVSDPANGTATTDGTTVTYTPDDGISGSDNFTYTIEDGNGGTATATVNVTINPVKSNNPPGAQDDEAQTEVNTSVDIDVLDNDTDADGDTLTISNVSVPADGTATINGDAVTYTPDADFVGTDSFTYNIEDGNGGVDSATVTVTVTAEQVLSIQLATFGEQTNSNFGGGLLALMLLLGAGLVLHRRRK